MRTPRARLLRVSIPLLSALLWSGIAASQEGELVRAKALSRQVIQLHRDGRYGEAIPFAKEALAIQERALGAEHPDVAMSLNTLGVLYKSEGHYSEAEPLYKRSLAIWEKALGAEHSDVATSLSNLAAVYQKQGRHGEAEPLYKRSLAIREKVLGAEHPEVAETLNNLGALYDSEGRYADAEPLYKRCLAIREKVLGAEHLDVAESLNNLAGVYVSQGRYDEAEPVYNRGLAIREKALGAEHPRVALGLNNLAFLYEVQARYAEAELLYKRSLAIFERARGSEHPNVATNINNLAVLYDSQGRYAEAEPLYKRSLAIREKGLGAEHPDVARNLNNLAALYSSQGRYPEAEPLYKRGLAIWEKTLGTEHPDVALVLNNLAWWYKTQARNDEAEQLYKRSLAIREKGLGLEHPDVARSLSNLAVLYYSEGRHTEAELLYKRSLAIDEKALGNKHPNVAKTLNNLGALYDSEGRYADAEQLYKQGLAIREKALGAEHPDVATSLGNVAAVYQRQGRFAEAEPLYRHSLAIEEQVLGADHPNVATSLSNLAALYQSQDRYAEALELSRRSVIIFRKRISAQADRANGTVAEQRARRGYFIQNIALLDLSKEPKAAVESFERAQIAGISTAGVALAAATARLAEGGGERAAAIRHRQDLAQKWQAIDLALIKAASKPPAERHAEAETQLRATLAETTKKIEALDARIAKEFPEYAELSNPSPLSVEAAQTLVAPDEALLVYISADDATWLWVLRHDRIAFHKIDLGAEALTHVVGALRGALDPDRNLDFVPFPAKTAHALYEKLLGPALPLLDGARHLLVVPDGALESLPLGVLVTKVPEREPQSPADHREIAWLARDYALTVLPAVTSLRALRQPTKVATAEAPFLGVGNPVLDGTPGSERGVKLAHLFRGPLANVEDLRKLGALPETADELRVIAKTLGAGDDDLLLGERASEPVLREKRIDRYRVIQFATHGLVSGDLPGLAEPALVLTPPKEASPENDGLLTASKVATLKLNADWVVLSACNTAAGDGTPDAGGLSGLAKAFFYAGARSLLVSHWKVPSEATVNLTTAAFDALKTDPMIGRAEALRRAEIGMLDPKNPPEFAHPLVWAPFVLAGEGGGGR